MINSAKHFGKVNTCVLNFKLDTSKIDNHHINIHTFKL